MLILKGDNYKSVVLDTLSHDDFNECIVWDEPANIAHSIIVDSNEFDYLYRCIMEINHFLGICEQRKNLLLIYTNKTEAEIKPLIDWLEDQEKYLQFKQVLVTCT